MVKLKEQFHHLCDDAKKRLHALTHPKPAAPPPPRPEAPARDVLTQGPGKIVKLMKPLHWGKD
jgi:hypothetical protein